MNYRWVALGIVYLSFLAYAIVFQSIPPILGFVIADLRLTHGQAGLLMSLFALPGVLLSIPAGILVDRYGPRNPAILCLVVMIAGSLLVAVGRTFAILAIGRVFAGAGALSLFVVGSEYVAAWFTGRELGIATGIYSTAVPVGTILSLNLLGAVATAVGWQSAVLVTVALSIVALASFVALYRPAPAAARSPSRQARTASRSAILGLGWPIWLVGIIWGLFNASVIAFTTFGPDYFASRGYGVELAGLLTSLLMLPSAPLAPVFGLLLDRLDHPEFFIGLGGLLVAGSIAAVPAASLPLIAVLLVLGAGSVLVPTPVFALPPRILSARNVGVGYGIVNTCLNVGVVVGPFAVGLARDATGSYRLGFDLMAGFALLVTLVAVVLALSRHRAPARLS